MRRKGKRYVEVDGWKERNYGEKRRKEENGGEGRREERRKREVKREEKRGEKGRW